MDGPIRADACTTCRQGHGAECACAEAEYRRAFIARLEPMPQPWTWRDAARAVLAVLLLIDACALFTSCGGSEQDAPHEGCKTTQPVDCAASGCAQ